MQFKKMNLRNAIFLVSIIFICTLQTDIYGSDMKQRNQLIDNSIDTWNKFISNNQILLVGNTEDNILQTMKERYRDKGTYFWGGSGNYSIYFLIDDFIQIEFIFNKDNKLIEKPSVVKKSLWLKDPMGNIIWIENR